MSNKITFFPKGGCAGGGEYISLARVRSFRRLHLSGVKNSAGRINLFFTHLEKENPTENKCLRPNEYLNTREAKIKHSRSVGDIQYTTTCNKGFKSSSS